VNSGAAELLVDLVVAMAGPVEDRAVLDLYGGVGAFALALAQRGARARVIEADPEAVEAGARAAASHGLARVRFERSDVAAYLLRRSARGEAPAVVVADPPRAGLQRGVAEGVAAMRPERVVLVSCDPATLARDVRSLAGGGMRLQRVVPVDLFPQTPHVETISLLTRASGPSGPSGP
jgi:23S rRNA (uracil1939-C5)-methyltransferase